MLSSLITYKIPASVARCKAVLNHVGQKAFRCGTPDHVFFKVDIKSSDSLKRAGLGIASAAVSSKVPGSSDIFRYI